MRMIGRCDAVRLGFATGRSSLYILGQAQVIKLVQFRDGIESKLDKPTVVAK